MYLIVVNLISEKKERTAKDTIKDNITAIRSVSMLVDHQMHNKIIS